MVWTGTDYWLRGAESPTRDGGNSWIQRREGLLGNRENNEMTNAPRASVEQPICPGRPHAFLWLFTSGNIHLMPSRKSIASGSTRILRNSTGKKKKTTHTNPHWLPVRQKVSVQFPGPSQLERGPDGEEGGKRRKQTHLRNGSTCSMLVNKDHTLDAAGERRYEPLQLFTHLYKGTLQQSSCQKNETIHLLHVLM